MMICLTRSLKKMISGQVISMMMMATRTGMRVAAPQISAGWSVTVLVTPPNGGGS
jgi:hypothetical protein